ncbi:Hypothetical protein MAG6500 [Mycoplasmopsis agalactiae PG2]|uniref:Uncharacterized protein n=1 Tax=Mycoplasmopsis agalactiae (strain NCTC 10123 / CIP 59.7 / PG2) TaxID=347257 RepID=A5IZ91_MYCAP|nr:Hypothetical protein MAG6500 [Mycoplasmopsis agalactiae PG2]
MIYVMWNNLHLFPDIMTISAHFILYTLIIYIYMIWLWKQNKLTIIKATFNNLLHKLIQTITTSLLLDMNMLLWTIARKNLY